MFSIPSWGYSRILLYMVIVLLENIRSMLNVGGVFRIADAVGAEKVLLVGYTPAPIDRMGRENSKLAKTALGAERSVPWQQYETTADALAAHAAYSPVAVEQTPTAVPYAEHKTPSNPLYIFGSETDGVRSETLHAVAGHIHLPMHGMKESLNVTTAAAVILYHHLFTAQA